MTIVPVYNITVLPHAKVYLRAEDYAKLAGKTAEEGERVIFLILKKEESKNNIQENSFEKIGVSGNITKGNENGFVVVTTKSRVNIDEIHINANHTIELNITKRPDIEDLDADTEREHLNQMKAGILKTIEGHQWTEMAKHFIASWTSMEQLTAGMSPWLTIPADEKYSFLETDSRSERMSLMEKAVYEYLEINRLSNEAETAQETEYRKTYREAAIKKQMEYLQKELDELHPEDVSDVRKLEEKLEDSGMNTTALTEARKILNRMKQSGSNNAEYGMLNDYLEFMTSLSWKKPKPEKISLSDAEQILDADHFGMKKVKERIIQQIAVMDLNKQQSGSILLFVGAPGTGKTSVGQSIAKALNRKYVRVSLGGVRDEADIRGHRRTYIGAMPGRIMDGIQKSGVSNPVMVLDEIDKLSSSYQGDPASALLEVLDPEQNHTFTDHYMNVPYDLSNVMFICTANSLDTIPEPLLNRMEVIQFPSYSENEKYEIATRHLLPKARDAAGISEEQMQVTEEAVRLIISDYTRESGVRGLKKRMDTLSRAAAVKLVKKEVTSVLITEKEVREYLDMRPMHHEHVLSENKPGVVTGLAWTRVGGEILFIETLFTPGNGKIIITGQLGDVMKESAQIAVSLVKSMYPDKADLFQKNDLHIHVPDGAVPKDGPSAGIALTTAISSLVNDHTVSPKVAMTGEVSLRGVVKPIGGLPEKLMAAQKAGVSTVFIPEENREDLKDVAQEVRERLEIIPVSEIRQVLEKTL